MQEIILDALMDSLKIVPFLFLFYVIIEFIENRTIILYKERQQNQKKWGPVLGSLFGVIPQCGFGVVGTKLYIKRYITMGTLIAIYLATSDEAIPIILSNSNSIHKLLPLISIKFLYAIIIGYLLDLIIFRKRNVLYVKEEVGDIYNSTGCCGHEIDNKHDSKWEKYLWHPLIHSLKILLYILIVNILFGILIYYIGEDSLISFMNQNKYLQPIFTILIGLIPNCASSVIITQLYITNVLTFGATISGLSANAGIALAVLFKENKNFKENVRLVMILVIASLFIGYLITVLI